MCPLVAAVLSYWRLGPKWYDTRKEQGGGAIDLTMHLFRLSFVDAVNGCRLDRVCKMLGRLLGPLAAVRPKVGGGLRPSSCPHSLRLGRSEGIVAGSSQKTENKAR
jgi:hypothetical protein